ncbi:MAG: magnesium transporter [Myxococcota bacterium]
MAVPQSQGDILQKLLRHGATERVARILDRFRPAEIADLFARLSPAEQKKLADILFERRQAADTLSELPEHVLRDLLDNLDDRRVSLLLERLAPDDAATAVGFLDEPRAEVILADVDPARRERIEHLRVYPPESAGSLMTSEMVLLEEDTLAQDAIGIIRSHEARSEFIFYVYVVNEGGTFLGVVPIRRLITGDPEASVRELMVPDPIAVYATDDQEKVADITARYNLLAVPVVDDSFRLLGVITVDDVIDVLQEEATEDMYLMQGLSDEDRVYSPVSKSVRKRFPWMVLNLITAFAAASIVGLFEESIAEVVVLATFMPVVAGMGGNGGTQTLTVVTRAIALGELDPSDGLEAVGKQMAIGLSVGAGIGLLTAVVAWLWKGMPFLGLVLFLAMLVNMTVAGLSGAAVPLGLKAVNADPAMGSGVLVTTFTDVTGFLAFLGLATVFIEYLV